MGVAAEQAAPGGAVKAPVGRGAAPKQFVSFMIDDELYGVDVQSVREIRTWQPVTRLPGQAYYTRGVLNIRGEALPVHDLRARFGGGETEATDKNVVVIVTVDGSSAGLLVDSVSDIVDVDPDEICDVPEGARAEAEEAITGLVPRAEKMIALVDVARLF
ncbi:MAG: purine-binding chemotaxis protein CheW [Rhodobacteraceae bacterium]|nr:MAG: purine-binding chemotaxis protein CheW [Paracoccaceae bacterium]